MRTSAWNSSAVPLSYFLFFLCAEGCKMAQGGRVNEPRAVESVLFSKGLCEPLANAIQHNLGNGLKGMPVEWLFRN